jgi:hypothetical protein
MLQAEFYHSASLLQQRFEGVRCVRVCGVVRTTGQGKASLINVSFDKHSFALMDEVTLKAAFAAICLYKLRV